MPRRPKPLGPIIAVYRQRPLRWFDLLTWGVLGIFAVLFPLAYGKYRGYYGYTHFGPVAATYWSRPWYLLAILALILFIILSIIRLRVSRRYIAVHRNGLRLILKNRKTLRWSEIAGIASSITQYQFLGIRLYDRYRARLYPNIGKPIRLDNALQNLPEFLTYIKAKLYPRLVPLLERNFGKGQWLHFGTISIQRKMIQLGDQQYQWSQVEQITINSGNLLINFDNQSRHRIPIYKIPNVEILLQLIQQEVKV